jgi:hypothetical protein
MSNLIHQIRHRVNQITQLDGQNKLWGAEIDLRSDVTQPKKIHLSHDAWVKGDDFEQWLDIWAQKKIDGTLILNTKEDGLEERSLELLSAKSVTNFFFLDTTIPTLVRLGKKYRNNFAVRYSSFENLGLCLALREHAAWAWVDCFNRQPVTFEEVANLKQAGFKVCLVSPELQGGAEVEKAGFQDLISLSDAICTKFPT